MPKVAPAARRLYGPLAPGFGSRVADAVKTFPLQTSAAEVMGLSADQLRKVMAEKSVPNFASIAALAHRSGMSLDWLAFALGTSTAPEPSTRKSFSEDAGDVVRLASLAGAGSHPFPRAVVATFNYDAAMEAQLAAWASPGDAMETTIRRDALLIVNRTATRAVDGEIFVFDFGGDFVVRRAQRQPDGGLALRADNASYQPMMLSESQAASMKVLGQVVWAGGRL